jgi:lipopolysaccharide/colanic/teichoic acid biosynthesis glycosyltransferase
MTGLAQVSGCRGLAADAASVRARTGYDVQYVRRWSIWLDLHIIIETVLLVLRLASGRRSTQIAWRRAY